MIDRRGFVRGSVAGLLAAGVRNLTGRPASDSMMAPSSEKPTRVLIMGDQGWQNTTQYQVAAAMTATYRERGADAVIGLGDNIYPFGAQHPYDPRFETAFEVPYAGIDAPFFMVLGNHDNGVTGSQFLVGHNEVAYHYRQDRTSDKWHLPDRYYTATFGHVELLVLDTNFLPPAGASAPLLGVPPDYRDRQEAWLAEQLSRPRTAAWRVSASHHPTVTNYGADADEALLSFMEGVGNRVDIHLSGHDHTLQMPRPVERFGVTEHAVVGASGFANVVDAPVADHPTYFQDGSTLGFAYAEFRSRSLEITFYGVGSMGEVTELYSRRLTQPTRPGKAHG